MADHRSVNAKEGAMARHILIVEESDMMRRVLQARILANLDDAVISEAKGIPQARQILQENTVHLILYGWDIQDEMGLQFCKEMAAGENGPSIPFLFLISDKKEHVDMARELVGKAYLAMPCTPEALSQAIDRRCSPVTLRQTKRYSINATRAVIDQRQARMAAEVVNISVGGALCEFELDPCVNVAYPVTISIQFSSAEGPIAVNDLRAVASTMKVMTRHDDQTPNLTRMGFKFLDLTASAQEVLARVFAQEGEE